MQRKLKISIQIVVGRLGWKLIERSVLQLLLLKERKVELFYCIYSTISLIVYELVIVNVSIRLQTFVCMALNGTLFFRSPGIVFVCEEVLLS